MKKAILVPVLAGIIGFILISQRDSDVESAGETNPALAGSFSPETREDESHGNTNPGGNILPTELPASGEAQVDAFRNLVSEIMQKNDLTPEEKAGFRDMLSLVSPPSR